MPKFARVLFRLRRDFPIEVGWLDALTDPAPEADWQAGKLPYAVNEAYGPKHVRCYAEYRDALLRISSDRLMFYMLWRPANSTAPIAHVRSKRFGADVEEGRFPEHNHLFRELLANAESAHRHAAGVGETLALHPVGSPGAEALGADCLVHDTVAGTLWSLDCALGYRAVTSQQGFNLETTIEMLARRDRTRGTQ